MARQGSFLFNIFKIFVNKTFMACDSGFDSNLKSNILISYSIRRSISNLLTENYSINIKVYISILITENCSVTMNVYYHILINISRTFLFVTFLFVFRLCHIYIYIYNPVSLILIYIMLLCSFKYSFIVPTLPLLLFSSQLFQTLFFKLKRSLLSRALTGILINTGKIQIDFIMVPLLSYTAAN
jgi:hypothetical protein